MELQELKHKHCPICRSRILQISQISKHVNGHWNEKIEFLCGCVIRFSPNFMCEEIETKCKNDPVEIEIKDKRNEAKEKLKKYVSKLDVDDEFKKSIYILGSCLY